MTQIIYDNIEGREKERWIKLDCDNKIKPIYEISNYGRVRNNNGKILKPYKDKDGYLKFCLQSNSGKKIKRFSHRLVAMQFISNPLNKPEINHIRVINEDNKNICPHDDNYYMNLEWCTRGENIIHSRKNNLQEQKYGEEAAASKFPIDIVVFICLCFEWGYSNKQIMKMMGFDSTKHPYYRSYHDLVSNLRKRKTWFQVIKYFDY